MGEYRPEVLKVQKRPRADILPVQYRASLVNKRFIIRLKKALKVFHKQSGPILREYWTNNNRAF